MTLTLPRSILTSLILAGLIAGQPDFALAEEDSGTDEQLELAFKNEFQPLIQKHCLRCHNPDRMTSGIRVDRLNGKFEDKQLFLWKDILKQVSTEAMPPEDEPQPTAAQRKRFADWIRTGMRVAKSRNPEKNGSVRRLTVAQYRNTLRDLLGLDDQLTDILPPDAVSKDGFLNNQQTMLLSPLLIEAYFEIAEKALDRCIVDVDSKPSIQNFRMDLGKAINPDPFPEKLILGANSNLLENQDFIVSELAQEKPFDYEPFFMRKKYRFIEGYQGNATVRGWREYDSIYHSVFACMRGNPGYPKGLAYETVPQGLLLRPAIPSAELFQVESTYGPRANFKVSLRELPDLGRFRVTVKAARYNDALMLDRGTPPQDERAGGSITARGTRTRQDINVKRGGIYQVDAYLSSLQTVPPDASRLHEGLVGVWPLDGDANSTKPKRLVGNLTKGAKFVDSPFGQAVLFDGKTGSLVVPRDESMNVGEGEFTVAAWIHPRELRQAGIVCLGRYNYTHGWYFDMPRGNGVLRIETMNPGNQRNGTVQSKPGVIRNNTWQHVAAVVRRGDNNTRLYVNGHEVAVGTIQPANLDNPTTLLHIGRIEKANLFKGEIDDVRIYRRALGVAEIQALVKPGSKFVQPPASELQKRLTLALGDRLFSGNRVQNAFVAVRLPAGPMAVKTVYHGKAAVDRVVFTPLDESSDLAKKLAAFEKRSPKLGVHVGLRRDCGSTLNQVGDIRAVSNHELQDFIFEGAIANYPSPDVEKDNVNYLAGVREIGVRSEYTDGRDMPRLLIRSVEFEGPLYENWPPATHATIFIESKNKNDPAKYARDIIRTFASRAFRRPVTTAEEDSFVSIWQSSYEDSQHFEESIKDALLVVLTSPQFLFLIENSETPDAEAIESYELASKLSYFLWNAAPDNRLLGLARDGQLRDSLDSEVERLIHDKRFSQFISEFASQWLSLDKFEVVEIDRKLYPKLTRDMRTHLRQEPVAFLQYLMQKNLPLRNLIQSDFVVGNEVTASYYDMGERTEDGFDFVAIKHGRKDLGGVLTQAGILAGLSNGRESNPVKRGAWLARKIIAEPPDDPPPNVPALPEQEDSNLTLRQKLERHRNQEGCAKCHGGIDPWGVPFEQFDAGGLLKKAKELDASSTLPDETEVADFNGLREYLASDRIDQVAFSFLKHLASYAVGRTLTYNELEFLKEKGIELRRTQYRMHDMVRFVVTSPLFLEK